MNLFLWKINLFIKIFKTLVIFMKEYLLKKKYIKIKLINKEDM